MFNIHFVSFPLLALCATVGIIFLHRKGGKKQPDKAGRENTLDNGEEDFHAPAVCRHWQDCDGRILSQQNKSLKVAGLNKWGTG